MGREIAYSLLLSGSDIVDDLATGIACRIYGTGAEKCLSFVEADI